MNFEQAIARVLDHEGGYTDGKNDPGGETKWGISKRAYPELNIKTLTREQAVAIYRRDFWDVVEADKMPRALQYPALDFAINSGPMTAIRKLQSAANIADDGYWGPVTKAAVFAMPDEILVLRFLAKRLDYMRRLSNWKYAGAGWAARLAAVMMYAADDLLAAAADKP